jgi:plasmid stabilization system protein ParE
MKVEISPTAREQLNELVAWWDANRPAAKVGVEDALAETLDIIAAHPEIGRIYTKKTLYRMWRIGTTPYFAFYRVDKKTRVIKIAAVWSSIRGREPELG